MPAGLWVLAGLAALAALWLVAVYNRLVRLRTSADNTFSTVDVQLRQRCDLVPNVVAAVKGYMQHERGTLERLTELRTRAAAGTLSGEERMHVDAELGRLLMGVMVQVENYPELKASVNVEQLQRTLNEVEAQIAAARRTYNAAVTELNTALDSFPVNLVGRPLGFSSKPLFVAAAEERVVTDVAALMGR